MARTNFKTVVGVFETHARAQQAVAELRTAGFQDHQIGVAARNRAGANDTTDGVSDNYAGEGAAAGVAAGAGIGALWGLGIAVGVMPILGPALAGGALAAILSSAAAGAAAAGLAGALVGLGISKEEAEYYQIEFEAGRVVVTITAEGRETEAEAILNRNGGWDMGGRAIDDTSSRRNAAARTHTTLEVPVDRDVINEREELNIRDDRRVL